MRAPIITYRGAFCFDLEPHQLWEKMEEFDQFEHWLPWLSDLKVEGSGLAKGTVLYGVVTPPLPYRMEVAVEVTHTEPTRVIDAVVGGDVAGEAEFRFRPDNGQTWAEVAWAVEMKQPVMRFADRLTHPLLQWGHDRVVEITVTGFRSRIERSR
jgi:carbon monoxide dehydrogenase subunit G